MLEYIVEMFSYPFMQRAFLVGILVSLCASLLGVSLVLKRYSMIGDGLSHVGFGALAVASALNMAPLAVAVPVVILAAFILLRLSDNGRLKGDAAIAMISTGALAVGVMVVSDHGNEFGFEQLYVRIDSCHEQKRRGVERSAVRYRAGALSAVLR